MDIYINNPTPNSFHLGTKDLSGRPQSVVATPRAPHMAFCPFYSEKGPVEEVVVDGTAFTKLFGGKTLDPLYKYYNHSSVFIEGMLADGGTIIAKRIVPESAERKAGLRLALEYVEVEVDEYERDPSGQFRLDGGRKVTTGRKIPGISYRWVLEELKPETVTLSSRTIQNSGLGRASTNQVDFSVEGVVGKRYPILDFEVSSSGAWGNLTGISIWAPKVNDQSPLNIGAMNDTGSYPFRLQVLTKPNATSNKTVETTVMGSREIDFSFKPGAISKVGVRYNLAETFVNHYNNIRSDDPNIPPTFGSFSRIHVYQQNIDTLLAVFLQKELDVSGSQVPVLNPQTGEMENVTRYYGDFAAVTEENKADAKYLFNLFTGMHSDGRPYQTFRMSDNVTTTEGEVTTLREGSVQWSTGGTDGEMNDTKFAAAVDALLEEFADENGKYMDDTTYNDSVFYDTGYPIETKFNLNKYMANRKDRWVCATTHVSGEGVILPAEENARLAAIRSRLKLSPDSAIFGTPTFRAIVVKGSGKFRSSVSSYEKRVPVSYEICRLFTKYWGAGTGRADARWDPTEGDNNYLRYLTDISNPWVPYVRRNEAWGAGGMWAERSESGRFYFPAIRTIYEDYSSTLMNARIMLFHVELNKIGAELRRRFSGKDWSQARLKQEAESWFYTQVKDNKFGGTIDVEGELYFTAIDTERSWSWHFVARVYGDNIKTVQTFYSENYRRSDKPEDFGGISS